MHRLGWNTPLLRVIVALLLAHHLRDIVHAGAVHNKSEQLFVPGTVVWNETTSEATVCIVAEQVPTKSCDCTMSLVLSFENIIDHYMLYYRSASGIATHQRFQAHYAGASLSLALYQDRTPLHGWDVYSIKHHGNVSAVVKSQSRLVDAYLRIVFPKDRCSWNSFDAQLGMRDNARERALRTERERERASVLWA
jgi:hypothetical protein